MQIKTFGASDVGLVRLNNEDVWAQLPQEQFFILADGMGGHQAGEVAANETVFYLCNLVKEVYLQNPTVEDWITHLEKAVNAANIHVLNLAAQDIEKRGMGTTLCLCLVVENTLIYAHVGDSRIYRFRSGRLLQLTRDHSLKEDLIASGELDESLALSFPHKNVITRAIGTHPHVKLDIHTSEIQDSDMYLLCSDGLTDPLSDAQIGDILDASPSLKIAASTLITEAKKNGSSDNITVLLLKTHIEQLE